MRRESPLRTCASSGGSNSSPQVVPPPSWWSAEPRNPGPGNKVNPATAAATGAAGGGAEGAAAGTTAGPLFRPRERGATAFKGKGLIATLWLADEELDLVDGLDAIADEREAELRLTSL